MRELTITELRAVATSAAALCLAKHPALEQTCDACRAYIVAGVDAAPAQTGEPVALGVPCTRCGIGRAEVFSDEGDICHVCERDALRREVERMRRVVAYVGRKIEQPDQFAKVKKALHREMVRIASPYADAAALRAPAPVPEVLEEDVAWLRGLLDRARHDETQEWVVDENPMLERQMYERILAVLESIQSRKEGK